MPYFDHNATTPLHPVAREAWLQATQESWQNPSSVHRAGVRVRLRLQRTRDQLATLLDCAADRIVFTSGATESSHAIAAHLSRTLPPNHSVAVNATEHPCVIEAVKTNFAAERIKWLQVNDQGVIDLDHLQSWLNQDHPGAVWVMAANNETGVLQPWPQIASTCRAHAVPYVCDAAQWLGKLAARGLAQADWLITSAHKFGGPKGVGFLLRPPEENGLVIRTGGFQEQGQRAGTEDYPAMAATVAALAEAQSTKVWEKSDRVSWRTTFEQAITHRLPGTRVLGDGTARFWNTVSLILPYGENHRWVAQLDKRGFEVSTGSACSSGHDHPSAVLAAMGVPQAQARRVIRLSAGQSTTAQDWQDLTDALVATAADVKPDPAVISP